MIVHILQHGYPLCRFDERKPNEWPEGHKWVGLEDRDAEKDANCALCRERAGMPVRESNWLPKIESLYAVLSEDEGGEGICAVSTIPLIAADETRFRTFVLPAARMIAQQMTKKIKIVKFTTRVEIEEIDPKVKPS